MLNLVCPFCNFPIPEGLWTSVIMGFSYTRKSLFILCFKDSFNILSLQKDKEKEEKQLEEVIVTKIS